MQIIYEPTPPSEPTPEQDVNSDFSWSEAFKAAEAEAEKASTKKQEPK